MYVSACRACLQTGIAINHIFDHIVNGKALSDMLVDCATIEVQESDLLPSHLCSDCTVKLVSAWTFRELVRKSNMKLHETANLTVQNDAAIIEEEHCVKYENSESANSLDQNEALQLQVPEQLVKDSMLMLVSVPKSTNSLNNNEIHEKSEHTENKQSQNTNDLMQNLVLKGDDDELEQPEILNELSNDYIADPDDSISKSGEDISSPKIPASQDVKNLDNKKSKYSNVHCKGCDKIYSYNYYHQIHIHTHMGNHFTCSICNKLCTNIYQLRKHRAEHQDQHICYICGENFETYNKLQYHRQSLHKNDKTAKADQTCVCDICGKSFKSTWSMYYHKITHKNGKPQTCNICNKEFMNEGALAKHIVNLHNDEKFICDECGKAFRALNNLQIHKTSHTTERTMPCPTCGKLFPNRRKLQMHLKRHSEDKPFICEYCNKSFKLNMVLKRHLMIHTGEKPHACKVCGKRFADGSTVVRHMLTHTGETPFVCQKCTYKCKYKQQFDKHMKKHK